MSYLPSPEKLESLGFTKSSRAIKRIMYTSKQAYGRGLFIRRSVHLHPAHGRLRLLDYQRGAVTVFDGCCPDEAFFERLLQAVGWMPA
ncbi:hypothetical protein [uncultured Hymenobacter sp.]|uniref:hypothetical protein n=1 Tax=uncultured Hymenobacter sp. TaxID=170016 RepID=UPI0035CB3D22